MLPGVLLALLLGAAAPLLTVLEASLLMPVIVLSGVFMVFLYGWAGRLPAWVFMTVQLCTASAVSGPFLLMPLAAGCLPAMATARLIGARRPFLETLRLSVAFYLADLLAALAVAYFSFGGNMIGRLMDAVQAQMAQMPDAYYAPIVENLTLTGAKSLTVAQVRQQLSAVMEQAKLIYETALPGKLIAGATASGVLSALWGSWLMARLGMATDESYIPLTRWFLPAQVSAGLMLVWITAFAVAQTGYAAGASVDEAAFDLVELAYGIQALAAIDRFFYHRGMPDRVRRGWVVAAAVLGLVIPAAAEALFLVGMGSAMFGSHGAFKNRFNKQ